MAKDSSRARAAEAGLSLIEAIVVVTITALLALILLPLANGSARRNFAIANSEVDAAGAAAAEREFRVLVRAARPSPADAQSARWFQGRAEVLLVNPALSLPTLCAREGTPPPVTLSVTGNALVCSRDGHQRAILRWQEGRAGFSYSSDGISWRTASSADGGLVRFELRLADGRALIWIERAGSALGPLVEGS